MVFGKFETNSKILPSLKFVSSPQLANKFFSLPWRDRRTAFTLAEVLITLVVIGVVAAITLPLIINQTQKFVLKQQFKKTYSTLYNAFEKTKSDLGYIPECTYTNISSAETKTADCTSYHTAVLNNLKTIKTCNGYAKRDGCIKDVKGTDVINQKPTLWSFNQGTIYDIGGGYYTEPEVTIVPKGTKVEYGMFVLPK